MKNIKHNKMLVNVGDKGHFFLSLSESKREKYEYAYINTNLTLFANNETEFQGQMIMPTDDFFLFKNLEERADGFDVNYNVTTQKLNVKEKIKFVEGLNVIEQCTEITNEGETNVLLAKLASANVTGIGLDGTKWFEDDDRFIVHYCINHMQGEGQWQKKTMKQLGFYPASIHPWEKCTYRFQSFGTWSTKDVYPLIIIEDTEKNECWFFEREGSESWFIEINAFEGFGSPFFSVSIGGLDEAACWTYDLTPNETYVTNKCFYGLVRGGFAEAVKELTDYKRKTSIVDTEMVVTFNDFMNCCWSNTSAENLIPLIDRAAEVGAKRFCIDDGWEERGIWDPLEEKFGDYKFEGIINYIKSKGMIPGVWFEFEATSFKVAEMLGEDVLLKRNGHVVAHNRPKFDLRNKKAREWLLKKIDYVYSKGVRYIKNDHNNDERFGCNYAGETPAEGLKRQARALYSLLEEIYQKYPDLVIENCAAGGGRGDHGIMKYCQLQSISDQENYVYFPSILAGTMALLPIEKTGIWSYPSPLNYKDLQTFKKPQEEIEAHKDGRQTIFNMVSGMCGYLYLSGRIDLADKFNLGLIKEGVDVYNGYKNTLKDRYPVYPVGPRNMDDRTFLALGLNDKGGKDLILAVWALKEKNFEIDLSDYGYKSAEKLYPSIDEVKYNYKNGVLKIEADKEYSAILLRLN